MNILQVCPSDKAGGAEAVAYALFNAYAQRGHSSRLAVAEKRGKSPDVISLGYQKTPWQALWTRVSARLATKAGVIFGAGRASALASNIAYARDRLTWKLGFENFHFPNTRRLLRLTSEKPDIVHAHNLHGAFLPAGGYFDLRQLPELSAQTPFVLTLHDAWLLSGHCAHSFDCERWKTGCGHCPDLTIYPTLGRDGTAFNWERKRDIYQRSRLYVATPCEWLMHKVRQSMLAPAVVGARVIPNGVDLEVFCPGDMIAARTELGLPADAFVMLFAANSIRNNPWKDYNAVRAAVAQLGQAQRNIIFVALGENGDTEHLGSAEIRFVPFESDSTRVARFYRAADVYLHAARADTFPNTVLEALACGTPVIATAVGGIPEQVKSWWDCASHEAHGTREATGILVTPGDTPGLARAIEALRDDTVVRRQLGENAAADARKRFDLQRQADDYLQWYQEILASAQPEA